MSDLIAAFNKYFEIIPANTADLKNQFFHLRYQVYSQELQLPGFESWRYPDGREIDKYDKRSVCCLLRHQPKGFIVGGIRLVFCDPDDPFQPFPIEEHVGHHFDTQLIEPAQLPRRTTVEVTRLVISRQFRNRGREIHYAHGLDDSSFGNKSDKRRQFPHPVLGLLVALVQMSSEYGITHWYAGMEPALNRLLRRFGFNLKPIGPLVDYYGIRRPYLDTVDNVLTRVFQKKRDIWDLVTDRGRIWPVSKEWTAKQLSTNS
ncbi:PEP-CTERM/exosortase system-associated acyltransferase [Nitrosococcus wardiae]|uniref:PEP-CTERM/exosortase system-associated acyltransferase n=1 Tax=Nitrosococcus wardiae TaxID=1814290 RepID=A0A4P7BZ95_9GAMM|nr:PEP-CTERM/exosortase system-associated acyltransferase [Nitrosococcus wardiae]QBQ55543.1 PEP-CTERM/exosortase system-associated acyltransferase [Nitrosococcus wardiae]